jgi:hypothetical protein
MQIEAVTLTPSQPDKLAVTRVNPERLLIYRFENKDMILDDVYTLDDNFSGNTPISLSKGDFNNDGIEDLSIFTFKRIPYFLFGGDTTYQWETGIQVDSIIMKDATHADYNASKTRELIYVGYDIERQTPMLNILCSLDDGIYSQTAWIPLPFSYYLGEEYRIASNDINGDQKTDILLVEPTAKQIHIFLNTTVNN